MHFVDFSGKEKEKKGRHDNDVTKIAFLNFKLIMVLKDNAWATYDKTSINVAISCLFFPHIPLILYQ